VEILIVRRAIIIAIALALVASPAALPATEGLEYQVKAAFLFNFLKFVEWPASSNDAPWVIGILGRDPFGSALEDIVRGKSVNGRAVEVRRYARPGDVKDCNILFVGRAESERMGAPVQPGLLTVGESSGFLKSGGIINFYLEDNRVHFEIRQTVARSCGLRISSQLLKLGRVL
jgi:uncharacterized protein DUF4154